MTTNHFDEKARTWDDDPAKVERARVVAEAVLAAVPTDATTRVLEYGAGTGLVSQFLTDRVGPIMLADPSAGMREVMHEKVAAGTLPADATVTSLDLAAEDVPEDRVDLVVTVMTLHHIPDLAPVLDGFAALLSDGGHLCIVDLEAEDGSFHSDIDFDGHHGFDRGDLQARVEEAGFTDVSFSHVHDVDKEGETFPLFLAVATAPAG